MRKIAVINQKGGVGKTTTTVNLGSALARAGKSVVLIDLDPQAHLTMHYGLEPRADVPNIYQVLAGTASMEEVAKSPSENIVITPSNIDLAAAEIELATVVGREVILRDAIDEYTKPYDFILMDCPPSLGILTINALCAANEVFITLQPHFLALQGMGKLLETINLVARRINRDLKVSGVVLCMYETGTKLANEVVADMEHFFTEAHGRTSPWSNTTLFKTRIRRNIKLAEAPSFGQDIFTYAPTSNGADDYAALAKEVLQMIGQKTSDLPSPVSVPSGEPVHEPTGQSVPAEIPQTDRRPVPDTGPLPDSPAPSKPHPGPARQG